MTAKVYPVVEKPDPIDGQGSASAMAVRAEKPTLDELAVVAYQLDELAPKSASTGQPVLDPSTDIADQIAAAGKADPEAVGELAELADAIPPREADARLSIARILARHAIERQHKVCSTRNDGETCGCSDESSACDAFDKFSSADRLSDSAQDIVAAAILMPKMAFRQKSIELGGDIRQLAIDFRVPMGAVALRRRILQSAP